MNRLRRFTSKKKTALEKFASAESIMYELLFPENRSLGSKYFEGIAPRLCQYIEADFLFIGKYSKSQNKVETLVFTEHLNIKENFTYSLKGTPCEKVIGNDTCSFPKGVCRLFPDDLGLKKMGIEGYVGIPLFDSVMQSNGILVALFKKPIKQVKLIESLLFLFTTRIGAEIEHQKDKQKLEAQNKALRSIQLELEAKHRQLDAIIDELNEAKLRAEESNQLKTAFLANLSHEVRTPMNVILGFSELLRSGQLQDEERDEYIDIINQNGYQLLKIMDNLIDISKLQTRLQIEAPKVLHINHCLEKLHKRYSESIRVRQKPIQLHLERGLQDGKDLVYTDEISLTKVLDHLLDNALKFTPSGYIKFGYSSIDGKIHFYVEDSGVGIPRGKEEVIFDLFRQVDLKATREFGGNGLGLALARKYISILGGNIWAVAGHQGGACFRFSIPFQTSKPKQENNYFTSN